MIVMSLVVHGMPYRILCNGTYWKSLEARSGLALPLLFVRRYTKNSVWHRFTVPGASHAIAIPTPDFCLPITYCKQAQVVLRCCESILHELKKVRVFFSKNLKVGEFLFFMIEPESYSQLKQEISERIVEDRSLLDQLRTEIRPLRSEVRRILPRTTTSISLVATDGGNNNLQFDPFLVQVVRIVDSNNNEYCLEAITPTTSVSSLSTKQYRADGSPRTRLGEMMKYLGVRDLTKLSHMIRSNEGDRPTSPSWVQVYRELVEWAILFSLIREKDFGSDTLIVYDGLLRSKVFSGDLFKRYLQGIHEGIETQWQRNRRKIYLAGVAKHSKVLSRYRLAMALEGILTTNYPAYLPIPRNIEEKAYIWSEYARGDDREMGNGEINKFVGGTMFFVKFGNSSRDPIWPIDIYLPQKEEAPHILGYMLADALNGFPVPLYPQCLQKAHANAALVDFDFDVLQNHIFDGIRQILAEEAPVLDVFRIQDADPSLRRYE